MKNNKMPYRARILIAVGLLLGTMPILFKEYLHLPDFLWGAIAGFGIGLEITGLILVRRAQKAGGQYACGSKRSAAADELIELE